MPKIRGIKPDYWTDEDIVELSLPARLLYIGLWNYACDNGHLQDKPKQIKMRILPGDEVNVSELLRELASAGRIHRGDGWITVPNLGEHQKIDLRYFTTCDKEGCEDPPEKVSQRESRRAHVGHTVGAQRAHGGRTSGARGDGDGDGELKGSDGDSAAAGKPRTKPRTRLPKDWAPTEEHIQRAIASDVDLNREVEKFKLYNDSKDGRSANWNSSFTTWLINAADFAKRDKPATRPSPLRAVEDITEAPSGLTDAEYHDWYIKTHGGGR